MTTPSPAKPFAILPRDPERRSDASVARPMTRQPERSSDTDTPFVRIELARAAADLPGTHSAGQTVPNQPFIFTPQTDERRRLFHAMRRLAWDEGPYLADPARLFRRQALMMSEYTDHYVEAHPFAVYFPSYQQMTYEQLRTYFTWRTAVREGRVYSTWVSYAFVYIYELLQNIGVGDPRQGLEKLLEFWRSFRVFYPLLDRYLLAWLKDYHVYYPMDRSFRDFADDSGLRLHYPMVFLYDMKPEESFECYADLADYDIRHSSFYSETTLPLLRACFPLVLERWRSAFEKRKRLFEDQILYAMPRETAWKPFAKALFCPDANQPDRQIVLSVRESYTCQNRVWTHKAPMMQTSGRRLAGYILKEMEAQLREAEKYRHKLTAHPDVCDAAVLRRLEELGTTPSRLIAEGVAAYYRQATFKAVIIDRGSLEQIRREAQDTQAKLTVPDDQTEILPADAIQSRTDDPRESGKPRQPDDPWSGLAEALAPVEREALAVILDAQDFAALARSRSLMPEVLADAINQKAVDWLGDALIEMDERGQAQIFDEYLDAVMACVKG